MPDHAVSYSSVFHVGDLGRDRSPPHYSQEGAGLSVSRCPDDWASIARLGSHGYGFVNEDALFYDASLGAPRDFVREWCVENRYIEAVDGYRAYYYETPVHREPDESDRRYVEFYDRDEAETLANSPEYTDGRVEPVNSLTLDTAGCEYWEDSFTSDAADASPTQIRGLLPVWYAEHTDAAEYDGVWWHNTHDPRNLSAPRGVIFQSQLSEWDMVWEGDVHQRPLVDELGHAVQ